MKEDRKSEAGKQKIKGLLKIAEDELEELEKKEKILQGIRKYWSEAQKEVKRFENWCTIHAQNLEKATFAEKRTMLEYLGIQVTIRKYGTPKRYTVTFAPPSIMEKFAALGENQSLMKSQS